ncbi:MAG: hypothetical protein FWD28_10610 [Treponema sp.]|nr:hypothetical protein [Treponema sp.]
MKRFLVLFLLPFLAFPLTAEEEGTVSSCELLLQVSSLPEAKLAYTHRFVFPLLQGDSPFTENNNLKLALTAEATPISLNGLVNATLTPIAFIEVSAGARLGTGWPLNLFGGDLYGTGLNLNILNAPVYSGSAFDALLWKAHIGAALQFDLAALIPGDWNHVIARTYHEINIHGNSRAQTGQAWYFENDDGENMNGLNYYGNFLIGYQMPIFLNLVGFLTEMNLNLYDTPGRSVWGDDLIRWTFTGILSFEITEQFSIAILAQFRTRRNFTEANWKDLHYQARSVDTSNPLRLEFYRIAAAITYRF